MRQMNITLNHFNFIIIGGCHILLLYTIHYSTQFEMKVNASRVERKNIHANKKSLDLKEVRNENAEEVAAIQKTTHTKKNRIIFLCKAHFFNGFRQIEHNNTITYSRYHFE